jgi:hypothetical protein
VLNPWKRARKVRLHLIDPSEGVQLPSVEGLLVSSRHREYVVQVPKLIHSAAANPEELTTPLVIPRERVAFYQVL